MDKVGSEVKEVKEGDPGMKTDILRQASTTLLDNVNYADENGIHKGRMYMTGQPMNQGLAG